MVFLYLIVIFVTFGAISATDSSIERQNTDNYDSSLSKYRPSDSTSTFGGTSGGYYPRGLYDGLNQNTRFNADLSAKEFRPPNVFAVPLLSTPSPYASPLMAQPRQYQISMPGASGLMPYHMNGMNAMSMMQSPGYPMAGGMETQFSGYNSPYTYGGVPTRLGNNAQTIGQLLGSDPYMGYGIGGSRPSMGFSQPFNPYSMYSSQGLYSTPYSPQMSGGYQGMGGMGGFYGSPTYGYLNQGMSSHMSPQFGGGAHQSQSHMGFNSGYNQYRDGNTNYNSNSGLGSYSTSGQGGVSEGNRESERNYASSASTHTESHTGPQSPLTDTDFQSSRIISKKAGFDRISKSRPFLDHRLQ